MPTIVSCCFSPMGEGVTNIVGSVLNMATFCDTDDEEAEEDVPQIKGQLFPQMCTDEGGLPAILWLVAVGVDAEAGFFVDVGFTYRDGNGEDGDVHHNYPFS